MVPLAISNGEVILIVVFIAAPIAAIAFAGAGAVYREIGKGAFALDRDSEAGDGDPGDGASQPVREAELRQLLEAKAYRRRRRGEPPLDVEAELRRLLASTPAPAADPALAAEVRAHVIARNARRERRGHEPLDVEAEVARMLRELGGQGG